MHKSVETMQNPAKVQDLPLWPGVGYISSQRCATSRLRMLLIACFIMCQTVTVSTFIIPGGSGGALRATRQPTESHGMNKLTRNRNTNHVHISFIPSQARISSLKPKTSMFAKEDKDKENDDKEDKDKFFNRVGRLGSRVVSSVKGDKTNSKKDSDDGKDRNGKRRTWTSYITGKSQNDAVNKGIDDEKASDDSPQRSRSQSPLVTPNLLDFFTSEVALANELKKQKALDSYVSGDAKEIPEEFLPESNASDTLGLDQTLPIIDESLSFVRDKLSTVRLNADDETNNFFLTPRREEQRLIQIRKDLELRRGEIIRQASKRKKEKENKDIAQAAKIRNGAIQAKRAKEEQKENEKKIKARDLRQTNINKAAKGIDVDPLVENVDINNSTDEEEDDVNDSQKTRIGDLVDGLVTSAGNAWQTILSSTKKADEDGWITVCPKTRISPGEVYPVVAGGLDLLIVGSKDGTKVHCISNSCSHLGTPLETGMIERRPCPKRSGPSLQSNGLNTNDNTKGPVNDGFEECIVCPLHNTAFALDTGEVRGEWCPYPPILGKVMGQVKKKTNLTTFQMRSRGKMLQIKISSAIEE